MDLINFFNSDFVKLFTLLLAIIAIVWLCLYYRPKGTTIRAVHLWYICAIATFVIIELVSYIVVGNPECQNIMDYVSFAATLASLILSVLAIFITVLSNNSLSKVKDSLHELPDNIRKIVDSSLKELTEASTNVKALTEANKESQFQTIEKLEALLKELDIHLTSGFEQNRQKIDELAEKTLAANPTYLPVEEQQGPQMSNQLIKQILQRTSYFSILLIYLIDKYLELKISKPISLHRLSDILGLSGEKSIHYYFFAFIVAYESMGLIKYSTIDKNDLDTIFFKDLQLDLKSNYMNYFQNMERYKFDSVKVDEYLTSLIDADGGDEKK